MATNFSFNDFLVIDTTGSIGIGSTNPQARLFVTGSNSVTSQTTVIFRPGTSDQLAGAAVLDVQNSGGSSLLFVSGSGNIGIGTTPSYKLDVNGQVRASALVDLQNTSYLVDPASTSVLNLVNATGFYDADGGSARRFVNPGGGSITGTTPSQTGALKIRFPSSRNNSSTMIILTVKIYEYVTGRTQEYRIGGYNYALGNWYNVFAYNLTDSGPNYSIRFGYDGTSDCIWIGETTSTWTYPQAYITEVLTGYSGFSADWSNGWSMSWITTFDTVEQGPYTPNRFWGNSNDGTGSGLDADLLDGYHASSFGLGTGTQNYVAKWTATSNALGNSQIYDDATNVGVGTATTHGKLTIYKDGTGNAEILTLKTTYPSDSTYKSLTWRDGSNITGQIDTRYNGTTVDMVFGSLYNSGYNTTEQLRITGAGNIGIGTTNATAKLTISSSTPASIDVGLNRSYTVLNSNTGSINFVSLPSVGTRGTHDYGSIVVKGNSPSGVNDGGSSVFELKVGGASSAATDLGVFLRGEAIAGSSNGPDMVSIFSRSTRGLVVSGTSANVGIGTTIPAYPLHVYRSGLADGSTNTHLMFDGKFSAAGIDQNDMIGMSSRLENSGGGSQTTFNIGFSYQAGANAILLQPTSGYVGIGTNNPSSKLHVVSGDIRFDNTYGVIGATNTAGYVLRADGTRFVPAQLSYSDLSTTNMPVRTASYTSITGVTGDWFPIFKFGNNDNTGAAICTLTTAAHSSVTFTVSKGWVGSDVYAINVLNCIVNENGGFPAVREVRIIRDTVSTYDGWVEARLYWSSGPTVLVKATVMTSPVGDITFAASLATSAATVGGTVSVGDSVAFSATNYNIMRAKGNIITPSKIGIGTTDPSYKLSIYDSSQDQIYIRGTSTSRSGIRIDNTAGYQSQILLADGGTDKWQFGKQTDNTFFLYDATATKNIIQGTYRNLGRSDISLVPYQDGRAGIGTDPSTNGKLEIYATGSAQGIYQSDGTRWMRVLAGTTSAGSYNDITQANDSAIIFSAGSSGTGAFVLAPWTTGTNGLRMDSSGNVGIGETSPGSHYGEANRLVVRNDNNGLTALSVTNATVGTSAVTRIGMIGGTGYSYARHELYDNNGSPYLNYTIGQGVKSYNINMGVGGNTAMVLSASSTSTTVGIGMTATAAAPFAASGYGWLAVNGTGGAVHSHIQNGSEIFRIQSDGGAHSILGISGVPMVFKTVNNEAMRIDTSQRVGIGTASPGSKLHVWTTSDYDGLQIDGINGAATFRSWLRLFPSGSAGAYNPLVGQGDSAIIFSRNSTDTGNLVIAPWTNSTNGIKMDNTGRVGIGTSSMSVKLVVHASDALINSHTVGRGSASADSTNVALGSAANSTVTSGQYNTAVGFYANRQSNGGENTAIGYVAMDGNTASYNTAVGSQALYAVTSGPYNTAVGYKSLYSAGASNYSVGVGAEAGYGGSSAGRTAIGYQALAGAAAAYTTAVGYRSLNANTTGTDNVGLGAYTLELNDTGNNNTAIGSNALSKLSKYNRNTAVGALAMATSTQGQDSVAVGYKTLYSTSTDVANVAVGSYSLQTVAGGSYNVGIGYSSLYSVSTGGFNVALGPQAGTSITSGGGNVVIGGYGAGGSFATQTNNIFLSDGNGNLRMIITGSTGFVGIGTTQPNSSVAVYNSSTNGTTSVEVQAPPYSGVSSSTAKFSLSIAGTEYGRMQVRYGLSAPAETVIAAVGSGQALALETNSARAVTIDTSQRVGVGTGTPDTTANTKLHVYNGNAIFNNTYGVNWTGLTGPTNGTRTGQTLDHYDYGTWSPAFAGSSAAGTYTLANTKAYYVRVGKLVVVSMYTEVSSIGTAGSGDWRITGLPYSSSSGIGIASVGKYSGLASNVATISGVVEEGNTYVEMYVTTASGAANTKAPIGTYVGAGTKIAMTITYRVT